YLPPLMDPVYGYQAVNVEAQLRTPTSLLRWLHRFIALRKENPVFALGTYEALRLENPRILAHVRRYEEVIALCVHNLARSAKAKDPAGLRLLDHGFLRGEPPIFVGALAEIRFQAGTHEVYQLLLGLRESWDERPGAVIAEVDGWTTYEGFDDPQAVRELIHL